MKGELAGECGSLGPHQPPSNIMGERRKEEKAAATSTDDVFLSSLLPLCRPRHSHLCLGCQEDYS